MARAAGVHPASSRTRQLSPRAQMVLHWRRCGRVCRRQRSSALLALFFVVAALSGAAFAQVLQAIDGNEGIAVRGGGIAETWLDIRRVS